MTIDVTLTFTDAEIDELIADGYDELRLYRGAWAWGKVGLTFTYTDGQEIKKWTIVDGTTEYEYADASGHADSVYEWAPYKTGTSTLGPVRPAFEPQAVRAVSLLVHMAQQLDPQAFVHSILTGVTDADTFADTKINEGDHFYIGRFLLMLSGNRKGECRRVEEWTQSGGGWELAGELSGSPAEADEYLVLPFDADPALSAIQQGIAQLWPHRARRIEDQTLSVTSGEQVYSIPAPIRTVERIAYLPTTDSTREVELTFEPVSGGRFLLTRYPAENTTLRVTGLAPYSIPYHLDAVTELAHPRDTAEVLARAELNLRLDPTSGLAPDADRISRLAAVIAGEQAPRRTLRTFHIAQAID